MRAIFWDHVLDGDFGGAFSSVRIDDARYLGKLRENFAIVAQRKSLGRSFAEFLSEDLFMKGAFSLLTKVDTDASSLPDTLHSIAPQWKRFVSVMTTGDGEKLFSKLVRDRVIASWVVLSAALPDSEKPRPRTLCAHLPGRLISPGWGLHDSSGKSVICQVALQATTT